MRLVYIESGKEVKVGDVVNTSRGQIMEVTYFRPPHKPASSGKVSVKEGVTGDLAYTEREYYVSVIGAHWIEREDRV